MYKLFLLAVTIGGFVFAGTFSNTVKVPDSSETVKSQFCLAEDTKDDSKLERRRRGKGNGKRKRGGSGLR